MAFSIEPAGDGLSVALKFGGSAVAILDSTGKLTLVQGAGNLDLSLFNQKAHSANGYQKLPGGLILQWGKLTEVSAAPDAGAGTITFPIAFPTACMNVSLGNISQSIDTNGWFFVDTSTGAPSATSFKYRAGSTLSTPAETKGTFWFALGY